MSTIETPESFCDRVLARTGVALAAIPDVAPEALLSGQILCARGRTRIVTVGEPVTRKDADGEYEAYTSFGVVERDNDLPAYLAGVAIRMRYHTHIRYRRSTVDTLRFLDAGDLDSAIAEWLKIGTNFPLMRGETEIARAGDRFDQYVVSATGEVRHRYG